MADISKIKLGNTSYDIKDTLARQMISGGLSFKVVWAESDYTSSTAPSSTQLAKIPAGVTVDYDGGEHSAVGTLSAYDSETAGPQRGFYLTFRGGTLSSHFDEYVATEDDTGAGESTYFWEKIGNTIVDLEGLVTDVSINKQGNEATVLGNATTFTAASSSVSASGGSTISAVTALGLQTERLAVTTVPSNGIKSATLGGTTTFNTDAMKATYTSNTETLELSSASTGTVSISTAASDTTTVATGSITAGESTGVAVVTGASPSTDTAVKSLGTLTAAGQTITVGTNDQANVLTANTTLSISRM